MGATILGASFMLKGVKVLRVWYNHSVEVMCLINP
jgi:hypothetical protein